MQRLVVRIADRRQKPHQGRRMGRGIAFKAGLNQSRLAHTARTRDDDDRLVAFQSRAQRLKIGLTPHQLPIVRVFAWKEEIDLLRALIEEQQERPVIFSVTIDGPASVFGLVEQRAEAAARGIMPLFVSQRTALTIEPGDIEPVSVGVVFAVKVVVPPEGRS